MDARKIPLKEVGENDAFKYKQVLEVILSRPVNPQAGMQMPEVRRCNKILDHLDTANGFLLLTPDEWQFLKDRIEMFQFGLGGRHVQQFADDVANAEVVALKE